MPIQLVVFTISLVTCSVNIYFLALLWFSDKHTRQVRALFVMGIATCYWILFDTVAVIAEPYTYSFMYTLRSIMLVVAPISFLWYMLFFIRSRFANSRVVQTLLWVLPSVDVLLLVTNPLHRLVFARDGFPLPEYGPLFIYHSAVAYVAIVIGVVLLFRYIFKEHPPAAFTAAWVVAITVSIVVNVLFTIGVVNLVQDVAPFGFAIIFMLFALYSYRSRLSNLRAAALSDVFESYKDAVVLVNASGQVEEVNTAFRESFPGCTVEAQGTGIDDILLFLESQGSEESKAKVLFDRVRTGGDPVSNEEYGAVGEDGALCTFRVSRQDVRRNGRLTGWLLTLSDVSSYHRMISEIHAQNERLEELRKKAEVASEAKSVFLAGMSHEMRTPLNAIIGLSEIVLRRELDDDSHNSIEKVYESGRNLLNVINDILDISKIESGHFELIAADYSTADMINDTVSVNQVRIGEKPIKFRLQVDPLLPGHLHGDELRVRQILNNYLSNAIKYTHEGEVELQVSVEEQTPDGVWIRLQVRDTGTGIKPEELAQLYGEYQQVSQEEHHGVEGTGLGLSICRRLTELMGGYVRVESEYGTGSTFTSVIFQEARGEEPLGSAIAAALQESRYTVDRRLGSDGFAFFPLPHARVLVVDDVDINLEVAKAMLEPYLLAVDCVTNGPDAIEALRAGTPHYDLVFMDQMMPGMDGFETVRLIREDAASEYAQSVPIVALTANAMVGSEERFLQSGFQGFLAKPIDAAALNDIIIQWIVQ